MLDPIVTVRLSDGSERDIAFAQKWPIRVPRPTTSVSGSSPCNRSAYPGYFSLLPRVVPAIPGGFGTEKL
ncbi:MAG: hypothetical protein ACLUGD_11775 [Ruminococcus sp.]